MIDTRLIAVCSECRTASCFHGEFMCDRSREADMILVPAFRLETEGREHPNNWSYGQLNKTYGSSVPFGYYDPEKHDPRTV